MKKNCVLFLVFLTLMFSAQTTLPGGKVNAEVQHDYVIESIKIKTLTGAELGAIPDGSFCLEAVASISDDAEDAQHFVFAIYDENKLVDVRFADGSSRENNKLTFAAMIPELQNKASLIQAFIWGEGLKPLSQAGTLSVSDNSDASNPTKVAPITGISLKQQGVYIKMTITPPADKTGIVSYEALIYNKNNPAEAVHRSITLEGEYAYYRLDDTAIFTVGQEFNTIQVISNGADGYEDAVWEEDISIVPSQKDISITDAYVLASGQIKVALADLNRGYIGAVFTRNDETVIDPDHFCDYYGGEATFYNVMNDWSAQDKTALENGEVYVSITGMNITKISATGGKWVVEFERIKSPRFCVRYDALA